MRAKLSSHAVQGYNRTTTSDLELNIKDFGPIKSGSINLKKLTVFIGPSNSGKSYVAILLHSILNTLSFMPVQLAFDITRDIISSDSAQRQLKKSTHGEQFSLNSEQISKIVERGIDEVFKKELKYEFDKNFTSDYKKLIRHGKNNAIIGISSKFIKGSIKINDKSMISAINSKYNVSINMKFDRNHDDDSCKIYGNKIKIKMKPINNIRDYRSIEHKLINGLITYFYHDIVYNSVYFPAARSGIMHAGNVLASSIMNQLQYGSRDNFTIPQLSGVMSDFLMGLNKNDEKVPNDFSQIVDDIEKSILHGKIVISKPSGRIMGNVNYKIDDNNSIPLALASSSISELAPFILYLKKVLVKGDVAIIEEPEAHLHPANQVLFSKILVKLVHKGLNIVITTHSPFILEPLSHSVQNNKKNSDSSTKLSSDDISVYKFQPNNDKSNTIVKLPISAKNGIPQKEFTDVLELLYKESYDVIND